MIPRKHKSKILLVSAIDDTFFSPSSRRHLVHGAELASKVTAHIKNNINEYYGVINLCLPSAHYKDINPFESVQDTRLINVTLNSSSLLNVANEISLPTQEGPRLFNGNDLDFLLPSKDFEFCIVGMDLNGIFRNIIPELLGKDYKVYLYSDMIKRFTESEQFIRSIKNRNFEYCSSKSALM